MTEDALTEVLKACYTMTVETRRREVVDDVAVRCNVRNIAKALSVENGSGKFGLMISGLPGNGKTTMLYAVRMMLEELGKAGIIGDYRSILMITTAEGVVEWVLKGNDVPKTDMTMAVDDFGREASEVKSYGNASSPMVELMEYRYNKMLYTILTTNLTPKEILEKYGRRLADRFREMFDIVIFRNGSYR